MAEVRSILKRIRDIMRQDAGISGDAQRIEQMVWIFFMKIFDDREAEIEVLDPTYSSPISDELQWRAWAADREGITGDELLQFVNETLFPTLKDIGVAAGGEGSGAVIGGVFGDAYNFMKSGTLLRQVINEISGIDFNKTSDRHEFGELYEEMLRELQSAGDAGEFYTPRAITQLIVDLVDPQLGQKVLDPACGTGGFLACTINHVRDHYVKTAEDEEVLHEQITGIEKKPLPHLLCTTNMLLHGIDVPTNVRRDNTLARPLIDWGPADRVDLVLTNPPFGGTEEPGIENNFPQAFRTRETADLFLVLIMQILKDGGRCGIVLPDGTLFGGDTKTKIKEKLLEECNLHTVVRLPKSAFAPYTSIRTNLLFFDKGKPTEDVWFYEHSIPEGQKAYNKTKPIRIEEFEPLKAWWDKREESEQAWKVSIDEIRERGFNLDIDNPNTVEAALRDPDELLAEYQEVLQALDDLTDRLSTALSDSLSETGTTNDKFFAQFGHLANAPDGVGRLRRLILDLAVRGRLVPQDPSDEPASVLLEQIGERRDQLVAEKKMRRGKPIPDVGTGEAPHEIPSGWVWCRLGALGPIIGGGTPKSGDSKNFSEEGGIPWLTPADLSGHEGPLISRGRRFLTDIGLATSSATLMPRGTVLFSSRAPIGYAAIAANPISTNQGFKSVVPLGGMSSEYLYWVLIGAVPRIRRASSGTTFAEVSGAVMAKVEIPVAPLAEQHRIVEKVQKMMGMCDELEQRLLGERGLAADLADSAVNSLVTEVA